MLTSLIGLLVIERTCWALLFSGLLPLVTIQRSAHKLACRGAGECVDFPFRYGIAVAVFIQLPVLCTGWRRTRHRPCGPLLHQFQHPVWLFLGK